MEYKIYTAEDRADMVDIQAQVEWAEFILHDTVEEELWESIFNKFPAYQLAMLDGDEMVGCANAIPLHLDIHAIDYNDRGWDWALEKGHEDLANGLTPNVLCGLQMGINTKYKGKGIGTMLIQEMKKMAIASNCKALILPIRPTLKSKYPLQDMAEYMYWKNKDGMPYDPWIRAHAKQGAKIVGVCAKSMYIPGTIAQWELWTGYTFQSSGEYIIPGALSPVVVSLEEDKIEYTEPNVWMVHTIE